MRLFYKLILLSLLPLLITVAIIIAINRTLTESTLMVGMERVALEHFETKNDAISAYFRKYRDILNILGSQDNFHFGDSEMRMHLMSEWEKSFPERTHRLYYYDGHGVRDCRGEIMPWKAEALGITDVKNYKISDQLIKPGESDPVVSVWVRLGEAVLGVSIPVSELQVLMDSMQGDDLDLFALMDPQGKQVIAGQIFSKLTQPEERNTVLNRLDRILEEKPVGMFSFSVNGLDRYAICGVVPESQWQIVLFFNPKTFFSDREKIDSLNLLILGLAIIPILLIAYAMNLTMIKPISHLMEIQREIGKGNLDIRVEGLPKDEIGQLGESLNVMVSNLRALRSDLASSEQRFRLLAENIPGVIYLRRNNEKFSALYLNDTIESLSGYPKSAFLENQITLKKLFHPEDLSAIYEKIEHSIKLRQPYHLVYRIRHRDGGWRWVEDIGTGVWERGHLIHLEGVMSNITERRKNEDALRYSESRYRALIEGANNPITIMAPDTRILLINSIGAKNLNIKIEECADASIKTLIPPLYEATLGRIENILETGKGYSYEDCVELPNGKQWFWSFMQRIQLEEEPNAILIMSYDITDRKQAEEALRYRLDFENLLADMSANFINIEHNSIDLAIVDALAVLSQFVGCDGAYIFHFDADLKSARLTHTWHIAELGYANEFMNERSIRILPGWRDNILQRKMNIVGNSPKVTVESCAFAGEFCDLEIMAFCEIPLLYQDKVLGVMGLCTHKNQHDWTEDESSLLVFSGHVITNAIQRRDAEESLVRYRDELEQIVYSRTRALEEAQAELVRRERLATLGQLTATVSHELRNPLGTIRGSFFTIAERTRGKNLNIERAMERVERNIVRCDTIIEELLDFTRTRRLELKLDDPDAVVHELVEDYPWPRNLHLEVELNSAKSTYIDSEKFRRCVINLLNNACEAMREMANSNVCRKGSKIVLRSQAPEKVYQLYISDNGPGIPKEMIDKIFEPLYSTKGFGVGLGLTLVQQIMEQHEGGIEVKSDNAEGTQILLWLPVNTFGGNPGRTIPKI